MKEKIKKFCTIASLVLLVGCGYTTGSLLPTHFKKICVDSFINKIDVSREFSDKRGYEMYRSGLESDITRAVIDRFIFDGNLSVVKADDADLLMKGELVYFTKEPLRYDNYDNIEEYRVVVSVNVELEDASTGKILWREEGFTGEYTYRTTGTLAASEESALSGAVEDLAKRLVEKTVEGW